MNYFVTGANGFIGQHLVDHLLAGGHTVGVFVRSARTAKWPERTCVFHGDVLDAESVAAAIRVFAPEVVFHLAAQSLPGLSWEHPADTFRVNVDGTLNVLDAVRSLAQPPKVIVACSSSEYAPSPDGQPITEQAPMVPSSPYAVSKLAADHLARLYGERHGIAVVRMYPFFLIGPGKTGDVCSDIARGVVAVERGQCHQLSVGNLGAIRDFLDIRDGVVACRLLAEKGRPGETYNICSGHGHSIRDLLDRFKRLSTVPIIEGIDPTRLRPLDEPLKVGDPTSLKALGWAPAHALDETLKTILEYWRVSE